MGPVSKSLRGLDLLAVATLPRGFRADAFLRLTVFFAVFLRLAGFLAATFFLLTGFLRLAVFVLDFFFAAGFLVAAFFLAGFFLAAGFLRTAFFFEAFRADTFDLVTLDFFPADFFREDDLRDAAFLREAAVLARFLLAAFLAAISDSYRFEKNAGLYIDCGHMEEQKLSFSSLFSSTGGRMPKAGDSGAKSIFPSAAWKVDSQAQSSSGSCSPFQSFYRMNSITLAEFDGLLANTIRCD